ncbi:MAG TPA: HigA family addiction module antitoxin [Chloroflexia bacterium]|jgi:addiction module HigA family antidote
MNEMIENRYIPNSVAPPGETLEEELEALGMTQAELAERTGRPKKTINEIIQGKAAITPETALQLEQVLGIPASFWNNLERHYQESLARAEERQRLSRETEWLKDVPLREMIRRGWLQEQKDKVAQVRELLRYFGVASSEQWRSFYAQTSPSFRKSPSFEGAPGSVAAWLRRGEVKAQQIQCAPYDAKKFREVLRQVRSLTREGIDVALEELVRLCASVGVAVVVVPELPKTRVSGAARWLSPAKALIQLSWRYKRDDQFWFTFFHEAAHILLHGKRNVYLDGDTNTDTTANQNNQDSEREADNFASDTLIPPTDLQRFINDMDYRDEVVIEQFATEIGIAPGIVVGKLQHIEKLAHNQGRSLIQSYSQLSEQEFPRG